MLAVQKDILWVGVGEAGGRVVKEILDRDNKYVGLFINTSSSDLEKLGEVENVFHIPGSKGSGRDRQKSKEFAKKHFESIIESIVSFSSQNVINLVFSTSGGSGSGLAPTIAKMLLSMIRNAGLDKIVNMIVVLPSLNESKIALSNTIACWNEIMSISKMVNNMMFIDNNCGKPLNEINEEFADLFDTVMNIPAEIDDELTQIDESDLGNVLFAKGCTCLYRIDVDFKGNKEDVLNSVYENSPFAKLDNFRSTHLCMSFNNFDYDIVMNKFKPKDEYFKGYNSEDNIMVVSGLRPPKETIDLILTEIQYRDNENEFEENEEEIDYIVDSGKVEQKQTVNTKSKPKETLTKKNSKKKMNKLFNEDFWENEVF